MRIIIVGCGKVGFALARRLSAEGHDITLIDTNPRKIQDMTEELDVMGFVGSGSSITLLNEAGLADADLLIAVTGSDELNLLCGMFAKKAGHCHAIARVRNPAYSRELEFIQAQMGISTIINPELAAAVEISRLLRFPGALNIDTFAEGRVQLLRFELTPGLLLDGMAVRSIPTQLECDVLVCAVERAGQVFIPNGDFCLQGADIISIISTPAAALAFFKLLGLPTRPVKNAMIVGGSTVGYYLAQMLLEHGIRVRLLDNDPARCQQLTELLPKATVIHGDAADRRILLEEGLPQAEAFVSLTGLDEENLLLALYAKRKGTSKVVAKVNRIEFDDLIEGMSIGSVVYPKYIICDFVAQYVRAHQDQAGSDIKTLYRILDDRVEALEFTVGEGSAAAGRSIEELPLKKGLLLCCITRGEQVLLPRGSTRIQAGDTVIVVTLRRDLRDLRDILA